MLFISPKNKNTYLIQKLLPHKVDVVNEIPTNLPTYVYADFPDKGKLTSEWIKQGVKVFGSSIFSSVLTSNQQYANKLLNLINLKTCDDTKGINIVVGAFWNGKQLFLYNTAINYEREWTGDLGKKVESAGHIVWLNEMPTVFFQNTIMRLEPLLQKIDYRGYLGLNLMVKNKSVFVKNFITQYNCFIMPALLELYPDFYNIIKCSLEGNTIANYNTGMWAIGVRFHSETSSEIMNLDLDKGKHLFLSEEYCIATAKGNSIKECQRRVYRTLKNLELADIQYRVDIGDNFGQVYKELFSS